MLGPLVAAMMINRSGFLQFEQRTCYSVPVRIRIRSEKLHLFHPSCEFLESPPICQFRIACRHHTPLDETNLEKVRNSSRASLAFVPNNFGSCVDHAKPGPLEIALGTGAGPGAGCRQLAALLDGPRKTGLNQEALCAAIPEAG